VVTAGKTLNFIRCCIALKYLTQRVPPPNTWKYYLGTRTIVVFFCYETRRNFMDLGDVGWAVSFHFCINYAIILSIVLCS